MRKLFLISAFVLASASAQASDIGKRASSSSKKSQASRRETDEQKARQIAAQYGISW